MKRLFLAAALLFASMVAPVYAQQKPTIVLVHGAFAGSSSWNGVVSRLTAKGYHVIAAANPLRGPGFDGSYVREILKSIDGPVVLVGHSYGGNVITNAANGATHVKALVYVSAFAPDAGESAADLAGKFPGSTLGAALAPAVELPGGGKDLYIRQDKFRAQFAADVSEKEARLMAVTQRPIAEAALTEAAGNPAWKKIPSWFAYGTSDRNIPAAAMTFMAERAAAKETVVIKGASHVLMVSHPEAIAKLIERAANSK
ncbi:alpha/beta fold hydrolase [Ferrovibrio xuzhouensis]|uniref:Alpha/beta fold hydrolase n=1 Tax=Ferrovibrio xuzhouensis TaxID=1576914 RepID=A0ABV7VKN8_9PROT